MTNFSSEQVLNEGGKTQKKEVSDHQKECINDVLNRLEAKLNLLGDSPLMNILIELQRAQHLDDKHSSTDDVQVALSRAVGAVMDSEEYRRYMTIADYYKKLYAIAKEINKNEKNTESK